MLLRIFGIVFPVFASWASAISTAAAPPDMGAANQLNMIVLLPALIFGVLSGKDFNLGQYGTLALAAAVVVLGSGLLAWPVRARSASGQNLRAADDVHQLRQHGAAGWRVRFREQAFADCGGAVHCRERPALHARHLDDGSSRALVAGAEAADCHCYPGRRRVRLLRLGRAEPVGAAIELVGQASIPLLLFSLGARLTSVTCVNGASACSAPSFARSPGC